jgi:acyl carrier protein
MVNATDERVARGGASDAIIALMCKFNICTDVRLCGVRQVDLALGIAKFDLMLSWIELEGKLLGSFEYATDLFDQATVDRFARELMDFLVAIAFRPGAMAEPIGKLRASPDGAPALQNDRVANDATGSTTTTYTPPRNAIEKRIVANWMDLLAVESIGVHDNFFDLGGHSLLAMHLIAELREQFAIDLPVRFVFEAPTPATLAEKLVSLLLEKSDHVSVQAL